MRVRYLAALGLALALAGPAIATEATVLGAEGELYVLRSGAYGELFPSGTEASEGDAVLALDVIRKEAPATRMLVPGTAGPETETSPSLTLHKPTNTVYTVWEAQTNPYSLLHLVSLVDGDWSDVVEYSGDPFSFKYNPVMTVTRHHSKAYIDGEVVERERTILHLVWWDEGGTGERAMYTPLVLQNGEFVTYNPVFVLDELLPEGLTPTGANPRASLFTVPEIDSGLDGESVVVAFTSRESGRLVTLEIRVLPDDLVSLAEHARGQVILVGTSGVGRPALADGVSSSVAQVGGAMTTANFGRFVATSLDEFLRSSNELALPSLAELARGQVILVGTTTRWNDGGLEDGTARLVEFGGLSGSDHALLVSSPSQRPAPATPERPISVQISPDGGDVILAWLTHAGVRYMESTASGWSERRLLEVSDDLTVEAALAALRDRIRN